jgi:beta-glucosidase
MIPSDFLWGAATSAYQIEGAFGREPCIWDGFSTRDGSTGALACDFDHRYREDIALMTAAGLDAFRFSISWPRVNAGGLDFYDRLVDALLEAGIRPFATLYHWDLPLALEVAGGWPSRATAEAFAVYVEAVACRLGDRVRDWATHNEPYCAAWLGYAEGEHAPGRRSPELGAAAAHHILLSHGLAVDVLRRDAPGSAVGLVLDSWPQHPLTETDAAAAWKADGIRNRMYFDPVLRGTYPGDVRLDFPVRDGDLALISAPLDWLGVNNYSRRVVRASVDGPVGVPPSGPVTDLGWEVYPDGLYEVLTRLASEYDPPPIYVTENGAVYDDDRLRIAYLDAYLGAVGRAIDDGVDVRGYFVWSLLDNFEWALGLGPRFGLVEVDYSSLERRPRPSFWWYRDYIAASRRVPLG